jgi:ABC-type multidrug transport system ATPase subunit
VNGDEAADMSTLAAYVEQDDALLGVLTVRETLEYAARLRYVPFRSGRNPVEHTTC